MLHFFRQLSGSPATPGTKSQSGDSRQHLRPKGLVFPRTQSEARKHIEKIRDEKLAATQTSIARAFNAVLKESANLYSDPAHFLLEMIQNADDNEYDVAIPRLTIAYKENFQRRHLRIDCNEIGFGKSDVESICSLSESSKSRSGRKGKYIGEKGMGFKSVFAVSDVVWIHSGHYSFKFINNDSQKLGMIIPYWDHFPQKVIPKHTSILLELTPGKATDVLVKKLRALDPAFLLFLRQLREVNIDVRKERRVSLSRGDINSGPSGLVSLTVHRGKEHTEYAVFKRKVTGLPEDARREGIAETELILAFPINGASISKSQNVHAFLPVRDHGFHFSIHADFILVASREDLDPSPWNAAIIKEIPSAFLQSVEKLNSVGGKQRYQWLQYIPKEECRGAFQDVPSDIVSILARNAIMETYGGDLSEPRQLHYVPKTFRTSKGRPVVPPNSSLCISEKYPLDQVGLLEALGVTRISTEDFFSSVAAFVDEPGQKPANRPHIWHSDFSRILSLFLSNDTRDRTYRRAISGWKIMPLRDGRWITPDTGPMLWPAPAGLPNYPSGIELFELHPKMKESSHREGLARSLGATECHERDICDIIVNTHADLGLVSDPRNLSDDDLISHVVYLLKAKWRPSWGEKVDMWFVARGGARERGSTSYMDCAKPYAATSVLKDRSQFPFIDKRYANALSEIDKHWQHWLSQHLQLTILPRLALVTSTFRDDFTMTDDFQHLLDHEPSQTILLLLRDWWSHYEKWIVTTEDSNRGTMAKESFRNMRARFSSWKVQCQGGVTARLDQTLLPRRSVLLASKLGQEDETEGSPQVSVVGEEHRANPTSNGEALPPSSANSRPGAVAAPSTPNRTISKLGDTVATVQDALKSNTPKRIATLAPLEKLCAAEGLATLLDVCFFILQLPLSSTAYVSVACASVWLLQVVLWFETPLHLAVAKSELYWQNAVPRVEDVSWPTETSLSHGGPLNNERHNALPVEEEDIPSSKEYLLLDVPDPEAKEWDFLEHFGVVLKMEHQKFLDRLREVQGRSPPREYVDTLYEQLEVCASEALSSKIRDSFINEKLIFIPRSSEGVKDSWVSIQDCVWEGPACLVSVPCLNHIYPDRSVFFRSVLQCAYANIKTLVEEARTIESSDPPERIAGLLMQLQNEIDRDQAGDFARELYSLRNLCIFPTSIGGGAGVDGLYAASDEDTWYIPDHAHLAGLFDSRIRVLAFASQMIRDLTPLFEALGMHRKFLSTAAKKTALPEGEVRADSKFAKWLCNRLRYVSGLVPNISNREEILFSLRHVEVFKAKTLVFRWTIRNTDGSVKAESSGIGQAGLNQADRGLRFYIAEVNAGGGSPIFELVREISVFCKIKKDHSTLISLILMERNHKTIKYHLQREGIALDYLTTTDETSDEEFMFPSQRGTTEDDDNASFYHHKSKSSSTSRNITQQSFKQMRNGIIYLSKPSTMFLTGHRKDLKFVGQLFVSKFLERLMKDEYRPDEHWTSQLRTRAGHRICSRPTKGMSNFAIPDPSRRFTKFLSTVGYPMSSSISANPTYHIDVYTSEDDDATFKLRRSTIRRAQKFTMVGSTGLQVPELLIVARICNVYKDLAMILHLDPWQLHVEKKLSLRPIAGSIASFETDAPAVPIQSDHTPNAAATTIYHRKLNPTTEIRLIELYPSPTDGPLRGELHHVAIDSPSKYWALSYVWGYVPSSLAPIYFETSHGKIIITTSLASALRSIRSSKSASVRIWCDAICIKQDDPFEKSLQIRHMGEIYRSADKVLAWLGTEEDNSRRAMEFLARLSETHGSSRLIPHPLSPYDDIWNDVNALLGRSYFTRAWIVQELVFASQVVVRCGNFELKWEIFLAALELCDKHVGKYKSLAFTHDIALFRHAGPAFVLGRTRRHFQQEHRKYTFMELMENFSYTDATLEQDKIFALRGLAYDVSEESFNPVYGKTIEEAARQYAVGFVETNRAMELLYRAGLAKSYSFASWIPHWTRKEFPQTISTWCQKEEFYAGQHTPVKTLLSGSDSAQLEMEGFLIDSLISTREIRMGSRSCITFVEAMTDFEHAIHDLGPSAYPTGETPQQLKLRIPIGNASKPQMDSLRDRSIAYRDIQESSENRWPKDLHKHIFSVRADQNATVYEARPQRAQEIVAQYWQTAAAFSERMCGVQFGVTGRGYAGLVPAVAGPGDKICVFHGGKVPFLVRENIFKEGFELVGECYIHGIMHGEGLKLKGIERRKFVLH